MPAWENAPVVSKKNAWEDAPELNANIDDGGGLSNAIQGFAARGNQAMVALNPFSDQEDVQRIANEQEWVKQHKGADLGQMAADIAITAPAGAVGGALARSVGSGLLEMGTRPGDFTEKLVNLLTGTAGAGIGEGLSKTVGVIAKPFSDTASAATKRLAQKAKDLGIKLNAAQTTGNKALQYMDSALDYIPSSSSMQQAAKTKQREAWQEALFNQGNQALNGISPEDAMGVMKNRVSGVYNDVSRRNNITVDQQLSDTLKAIADRRNMSRMDVNKRPIIQSYLKEFNVPVGSKFGGEGYQSTRSMLDKQAKAMRSSNPAEAESLSSIKKAIDEAMGRSVNPADRAAWNKANKDWMVMKNIESSIDPVQGDISPNKLLSQLTRKDPNRVIYGQGDQELTDIAKVGKEFISPKVQDSGTAQRQAMIKLLTGAGAAGAAEEYARTRDPISAGIGGTASLIAAALLPRQASKMLWSNDGYFSKGLADLSKEALPGLTRQRVIDELLRNAGVQLTNQ